MGRNIRQTVLATGIGFITLLLLCAGFAWLILHERIEIEHKNLVSAGILIASSAMSALAAGKGEGRIFRTAAAGGGLVLLLGVMNLIMFEGDLTGIVPVLLLVSGTCAAVLLARSGKQRKTKGYCAAKKQAISKLNKKQIR